MFSQITNKNVGKNKLYASLPDDKNTYTIMLSQIDNESGSNDVQDRAQESQDTETTEVCFLLFAIGIFV